MIWMELEGIMLSEISQSEKDNYQMISLICGILRNKTEDRMRRGEKIKQEQTRDEDKP